LAKYARTVELEKTHTCFLIDIVHTKSASEETVTFSSLMTFDVLIKPPKLIAVSPEQYYNSKWSELEKFEYN
jgi:hypothetical protein